MTREQAINYLISSGFSEEQVSEVVRALTYEPTTKNDSGFDCISRADVLKLMQDNWHTHNGDWAMQESMDDIRALPSVTPQEPCDKCEVGNPCLYCKHEFEAKTGHWIALENRFELGDRVKCSECGQVFVVGDDVSRHYCPNCGAKMVEPQEREDKE